MNGILYLPLLCRLPAPPSEFGVASFPVPRLPLNIQRDGAEFVRHVSNAGEAPDFIPQ
jgi:hypothetical protein